ncbi:MAG: hypothetical protein WBH19_09805 [Candidatus Nanopelagicales bacterium]
MRVFNHSNPWLAGSDIPISYAAGTSLAEPALSQVEAAVITADTVL